MFYTSALWQCCSNSLYGLVKRKLCQCNNALQSYILQNCSVYLPWSATTTTLLLCLLMEIPTKRRLFCCLGIGRWIYMSSFFQKVADKWLSKRAGWFIAHLWYRSYHTILGKHSENLKWKGTGLILIYICNDREDPSSYMNISTIKRQSLNQGKFEPLWDFFWKNWHCSIQNIWTMWNGKHW